MNGDQLKDLLLASLEHDRGRVLVYETALQHVHSPALAEDWADKLRAMQFHVEVLADLCEELDVATDRACDWSDLSCQWAPLLADVIRTAVDPTDPGAVELVARECILFAETHNLDGRDWFLKVRTTVPPEDWSRVAPSRGPQLRGNSEPNRVAVRPRADAVAHSLH